MHLTWLDSNSWLIEMGGQRILLDPWLKGSLMFGKLPWLFRGERRTPRTIPDAIDLILLSQGLADHAHLPTLQLLDRQIPVVASPNAAKIVTELNYTQVNSLRHGETYVLADRLEIHAVPGSPIGPVLVENGYVLRDRVEGTSLYYEPHGFHSPTLKAFAPVDVVITPIINLELPLIGAVIQGKSKAVEVAEWLRPQFILPTAAGGDVDFTGLLLSVLQETGSVAELQQSLVQQQLPTQVIEPKPGDRVELALAISR